jgi:hypothetical protein
MAVRPFVLWPVWQRAVLTNATAAVGVYIGIASSSVKPSLSVEAYIAVFTMALMNLMTLVAMPRIRAQKTAGKAAPNPWRVVYDILAERPFITAFSSSSSPECRKPLGRHLFFGKDRQVTISGAYQIFRL